MMKQYIKTAIELIVLAAVVTVNGRKTENTPPRPVTSVTLNKTELSLAIGGNRCLIR